MAYTYSAVEAALAKLHQIDEQSMGSFRARVQNFQKMGVAIVRPGKGNRVLYNRDAIFMWAFCLELSEIGMGPTAIKGFISEYWNNTAVRAVFGSLNEEENSTFFVFDPNMLRQLDEQETRSSVRLASSDDLLEKINHFEFRAIVINISNVRDRLVKALADLHHQGDIKAAIRAMG